jgi:endonuclease/exonuclease/phosphatase family metal-dependent hydrolase
LPDSRAPELRILCWNIYHGRDRPPDPALYTRRSRLWRKPEDNGTYLQVNQPLREEFTTTIAQAAWSLCLLQEAPPAWSRVLAKRSGAPACRALTSRNWFRPLTSWLARWNPDLIASWEGGSNLTLARPPWRMVERSCRSLLLNPQRERFLIERRQMSFTRVRLDEADAEVCVANLHASTRPRPQIEGELLLAAATAIAWAGEAPLVLGGDFNLRPSGAPALFDRLEREFGFSPPSVPDAIDHLLVRGLDVVKAPAPWPDASRELEIPTGGGPRRLRLSDHTPVDGLFAVCPSRCDTRSVDG